MLVADVPSMAVFGSIRAYTRVLMENGGLEPDDVLHWDRVQEGTGGAGWRDTGAQTQGAG